MATRKLQEGQLQPARMPSTQTVCEQCSKLITFTWCDACLPKTINELCDRAQAWAEHYYRLPNKDGQRELTGEHANMRDAMRALRSVAGDQSPTTLRAEDLYAAQEWMLAQGLSRRVINARINRLRRIARWAARPPRRWLASDVPVDLKLVDPLKWGRSSAPEHNDVQPVSWDLVSSTMVYIPPTQRHLYVMIELQWLTGMRPGELARMERDEFETESAKLANGQSLEVMVYKPFKHKTRHHGFDRNIFMPPEARRIVEDRFRQTTTQTLWPYTTNSYREAVTRLCKQHDLEHWTPAQIRHSFATRMRSAAGIDVVQVLMGHRHKTTTEIYALPDASAAINAIFKFG